MNNGARLFVAVVMAFLVFSSVAAAAEQSGFSKLLSNVNYFLFGIGGSSNAVTGYQVSGSGGGSGGGGGGEVAKLPPCGSFGDVNGDGGISKSDASLVSDYLVGNAQLTDSQLKRADVTADGKVSAADSLYISQYLENLRTTFPACTSDSGGGGAPAPVPVPVPVNTAPKIVAEIAIPPSIEPGQKVEFGWSATDADGDGLAWSVCWGDNTCEAQVCPLTPGAGWTYATSHSWSKSGTYAVQASVNDCGKGGSDSKYYTIVVGLPSLAPDLVIYEKEIRVSPSNPQTGTEVVFAVVVRNKGNKETKDYSFSYEFGDGGGAGGAYPLSIPAGGSKVETLKHVYNTAGTYTAIFTAGTSGDVNPYNNKASKTVAVVPGAPGAPAPDLNVTLEFHGSYPQISPPTVDIGNPVLFTAVITNIGNKATTDFGFGYDCGYGGVAFKDPQKVIAPGETITQTFECKYTLTGVYTAIAAASTTGDSNPSNDKAFGTIFAVNPDESAVIKRQNYFAVGGIALLWYEGSGRCSESKPAIVFELMRTKEKIVLPLDCSGNEKVSTIKIAGKEFGVYNASPATIADFNIRVDISGDGKLEYLSPGDSVPPTPEPSPPTIVPKGLEIVPSGSSQLYFRFGDDLGNLATVPVAYANEGDIKVGDSDDDLILDKSKAISRKDYLVLSADSNIKLGYKSYALRYISAMASTETKPKLEFQDLGTGSSIYVPYTAQPREPFVGAPDAVINIGGATFNVWNASPDTSINFDLKISLSSKSGTLYPLDRKFAVAYSGSNQLYLTFADGSGNHARIPFAYSASGVKLGDNDNDLILGKANTISRNDYLILGSSYDPLSNLTTQLSQWSYALRYIKAMGSGESSPELTFQNLGTGASVYVPYTAKPGDPGVGIPDARIVAVNGKAIHNVWNASVDTSSNFNIRVDLEGQPAFTAPPSQPPLTTPPYPGPPSEPAPPSEEQPPTLPSQKPAQVQPVQPEDVLAVVARLDSLKVSFDQMRGRMAAVSEYYSSVGDAGKARKYKAISALLESLIGRIELSIKKISAGIDTITKEEMKDEVSGIRSYIREIVKAVSAE